MTKKITPTKKFTKREKRNGIINLSILLAIITFLIVFFSLVEFDETSDQTASDLKTEAYVISQNFIKATLKYPHTADFPYMDYKYNQVDSITYEISSHFTAENKLGLEINSNYYIKLKYNGGDKLNSQNWKVLDLKIE